MTTKSNEENLSNYLEDTSHLIGHPSELFIPSTRDEMRAVVSECVRRRVAMTLAGGRTGTTGGCVASGGAIVALERLDRIRSFDADQKTITVEAGVTLAAIEKEAQKHSLSFRAAPTEDLAYIGGAIATGASGVRGFGYGSIRAYVRSIEALLSTGEILNITRGQYIAQKREFRTQVSGKDIQVRLPSYSIPPVKSQAGYYVEDDMDLIDLFIGSEGTLGIVLSAQIKLQPMPGSVLDGLVFFRSSQDALRFVSELQTLKEASEIRGLISLEYFDKNSLAFLASVYSFVPEGACAVYFEQEAHEAEDAFSLDRWDCLVRRHDAYVEQSIFADTPQERARVFEFRHRLPQLINEFLRHKDQIKVASDCAVPRHRFSEMYDFYARVGVEHDIAYVNFGHIGESHLHFNFLPQSDQQQRVAREALMDICTRAIELGGTVSAEHGIGKLKKQYLKLMYSQSQLKEMAALKYYFDPVCLLNLDNIFDKELLAKP